MTQDDKYFLTANGSEKTIELTADQALHLDAVPIGTAAKQEYHVIENNRSYEAEVRAADFDRKIFSIKVNNNFYEVKISDSYDKLVKDLGLTGANVAKTSSIKAPMPGLVLSVIVAVGQVIQKGDTLLILEAMKMENVLKAADEGVVRSVHVEKGASVEKGQLLIEME